MNIVELKGKLDKLAMNDCFVSSAHTSQHRIFGFITTNIRSIVSMAKYVEEIVPEYIKRKQNYESWKLWFKDPEIQLKEKQKFKRLELAKILFRYVKDSPTVNNIGEKLYRIYETYGFDYLVLILSLYLLTGRYYDVDNQPLVEINKVLANYSNIDNFYQDATSEICSDDSFVDRGVLSMLFYNPSSPDAMDISFALLQNKVSNDCIPYLNKLLEEKDSLLWKRKNIAGGLKNFKSEFAICFNYFLFKKSCVNNSENLSYENIMNSYVDLLFDTKLSDFFKIKDKDELLKILLDSANRVILKDVCEFALDIKFTNEFVRRKERKNIKQISFEKYGYKCFFDCVSDDETVHRSHECNYFETEKGKIYLEGHHMVQMENAKLFEKNIDIPENVIPVCPNCHRKIHNAKKEIVSKMIEMYYNKCDKKELQKKGIFVDIETLKSFYGIIEDD